LLKRWLNEADDDADDDAGGAAADEVEPPTLSNVEHADRRASAATPPTPHAHARALLRRRIIPSVPVAVPL
jgi:hypothetical protein